MSEVRPWIGSYISLGQFTTLRELEIIDCSYNHGDPLFYFSLGQTKQLAPEEVEKTIWSSIDRAFAAPTTRDDDVAAYAATQIIAELFKGQGYDGIAYRSNFGEDGHNIALFDIDAAELINCQLHKVETIEMKFSVQDNMYFTTATAE